MIKRFLKRSRRVGAAIQRQIEFRELAKLHAKNRAMR